MKKPIPVVLKDSKNIRNIVIQIDLKNKTTSVLSGFSTWDNLALIMEALGATAEKCIQEGIDKKQVYQEIKDYIMKVLSGYEKVVEMKIEDFKNRQSN